MNEENINPPSVKPNQQPDSQDADLMPPPRPPGERVIQPPETIQQAPPAQQQIQPQVAQPTNPIAQSPQPNPAPIPADVYSEPAPAQAQIGLSASQLGLNQPKNKLFDISPKQLMIRGLVALIIIGSIFTALLMTNIISFSEFKNVGYTDSKGTNYKLEYYSKHGSKQLKSGNKQLVSKVSKDGKFPIALSISTGDDMRGYNRAKDCSSFTKVFDVQNDNLDQKISICDFGKQGQLPSGGVYIAGFLHNNKAHIIAIGQDYGDIDLSSQSGAQKSLTRFGMEPYRADIERIISSIKVE